jgi:hypothetical protein
MCVLLYKFSKRNFGDLSARYTALIAMLMPNFIYYCGIHLKETTMIFLVVLFMERADNALRGDKVKLSTLIVPILAGFSLFLYRTVLAASVWMAFFTALVFTSSKAIGWGKRILVGFWFVVIVFFLFSSRLEQEVGAYWSQKDQNQTTSMKARSTMKGGNKLAEYGSAVIFAPVIFIAPFPTLVNIPEQQNQMYMNGGYMVKNVMAYFLFIALITIVLRYKSYRRHILLLAFVLYYLIILAFSAFALSERFHLPVLPFLVVLMGFGITQINKKRKSNFSWYLIFIGVLLTGWNLFKLAGRGLL